MNHAKVFRTLLEQMNPAEMAQHSTINHHADGVQYLCLHRTPRVTAKIYLIEQPSNPNSGYLVHPHSHRYPFASTVLAGGLMHLRFAEHAGGAWSRYRYHAEGRQRQHEGDCDLILDSREHCAIGRSYFVEPFEIHTLQMIPVVCPGPVMIGLMQFADTQPTSELYLPAGVTEVAYPESRQPTVEEAIVLRNRCLELLK